MATVGYNVTVRTMTTIGYELATVDYNIVAD